MKRAQAATVLCLLAIVSVGQAATTVTEFLPSTPTPTVGQWYLSDVRDAGTASIVDLTGVGGNLETNLALPTGAALLTTTSANSDKAEVATYDNYGKATTVLSSIGLSYDYYKTDTGVGPSTAPSIKLGLYSASGSGDNYGMLVYEPYWNGAVPTDTWTTVTIDNTTGGGGADNTGGWWWSGGFEIGNSFGGPPLRSLSEWITAFTNADADFADADLVSVSMGIGSYNPGQIDYFDNLTISGTSGLNTTYDFEAPAVVPVPGALLLGGLGAGLVGWMRRKQSV